MSTSNTNLAETVNQDYQKALKASIAFQEKQRKLIDALAGRLEELGSGDVLDTTGGGLRPSPSSSTAGVGPNSGPIPWNGTPNDIPTFSIGGKLHKAHILTDDIVKLFNTRLDMRLKICKYNQELERERNEGDKTLVEIQGFMDIEARGETVDSAELERLKSMHAYSLRRFQILADEFEE
ncbi:uncharacterized protein PAC_17741 [Phialocephala subalpina]|uniref:Uncharacterized protein n=1 Tax=Phialocephala subalpina TaxID=576137 RepID=A0A1L7XS11_9HELO|nr:uncharacterized protein PAC_17741 [Phialocephala subalpina]